MEKKFTLSFKSIGTKTLIVLIALSFALWGVGDIFTTNTNPVIANVGKEKIKLNEFRLEYNIILDRLRKASSEPLTDEFVKAMGLHNNVLENIIAQKYISIISNELGIDINEKYLKKSIFNNPLFRDQIGVFNKDYFNYYLNQNNISEKELLIISKSLLKNDIFLQTLNIAGKSTNSITKSFIKKRDIVRKAEIYKFNSSNLLFSDAVEEEVLKSKYEEVKNNFLTPEERDIELIKINGKLVKEAIVVENKEIEDVYIANKDIYIPKEKRSLYQHVFDNEDMAIKFYARLDKNNNFFEVLKEFGLDKEKSKLGEIEKGELSPELEKIVFNLKEKGYSNVIKTPFGYKVIFLEEIIKPIKRDINEIKSSIKKDLFNEKLDNKLYTKANEIYDDFILNKNIVKYKDDKEVDIIKIKSITLENVKKVQDKIKSNKLSLDDLTRNIFNLETNEISDSIEDGKNNIYFILVNNIKKSKVKSYSDVKNELTNLIYNERRSSAAKSSAVKYLDSLLAKKAIKNNNKEQLIKTKWITYDDRLGKDIEAIIKKSIFSTPINNYSKVVQLDQFTFFIVKPIAQKDNYLEKDKLTKEDKISIDIFNSINADVTNALLLDLKKLHRREVNKNFLASF